MVQVLLIIEVIVAWAVLTAIQYPLRKERHRNLRIAVFLLKVILIPIIALLAIAAEWFVAYTDEGILCALYIALIGDVITSLAEYIIRRLKTRGEDDGSRHGYDHRIGMPLGLCLCIVVLAFAATNADSTGPDHHDWQADGLEREHTFAFAADLHTGGYMSMDAVREFCKQVNESDAEFLILGGDITDEHTSYADMVETYRILSMIDIPTYLIYGNHDRQPGGHYVGGRTYTDEQLLDAIHDAGITLLVDEYVQIADDLVLLGREDISVGDARKPWSELVNPYGSGALIVADHQPYDSEQLKMERSVLQLSGHTHAGQLWPLCLIYNMLGYPAYGDYWYPGTHLYVTPGLGGWAPPLRTEALSAWELVTLHP